MIANTGLTSEELSLLCKFDTPTVCNVIELLNVRPATAGYMDGRIKANFAHLPPMVGYAVTATFRSAAAPKGRNVYSEMDKQIVAFMEIPVPRVVVFQDLDNPPAAATFGEVMCAIYKTFGCVGLITSGAGRDLDQVETMSFPVYSSQTVCAHGFCHIVDVNVPVHVGGVTINPCDLIHGDRNGVTTIPKDIAREVVHGCGEYMAAERELLDGLRLSGANLDALREAEKKCDIRIKELAEHLRGKVKLSGASSSMIGGLL
jgi:regulator of RNase E activity RraA